MKIPFFGSRGVTLNPTTNECILPGTELAEVDQVSGVVTVYFRDNRTLQFRTVVDKGLALTSNRGWANLSNWFADETITRPFKVVAADEYVTQFNKQDVIQIELRKDMNDNR